MPIADITKSDDVNKMEMKLLVPTKSLTLQSPQFLFPLTI